MNTLDREYILNELRDLKLELCDRYKVTKIGVFGSVARNEATEESDIDIVVEMEPNILKRIGLNKKQIDKGGTKHRLYLFVFWSDVAISFINFSQRNNLVTTEGACAVSYQHSTLR
ncbi:MAG: nucleotidyltransferase family protein [Pseudanabaena sp.]